MLLTNRNKYKFSPKWAFGRGRGRAVKVEKPRERGRRAHKGGLGGPAVAVKPRAPRRVSPAQETTKSRASTYKLPAKGLFCI